MSGGAGRAAPGGSRPSVLVLRALGLGDFLTGVPAYRALRAAYPGHRIVLAAPRALTPLARLTGAIDEVLDTAELAPVAWPGPPPELAVDLHGNGPASHRLVEALGAGRTLRYASAAAPDVAGPWWDDAEHEVTRWCRLLEWGGIPADPARLHLAPPAGPPAAEPIRAGGYTVLHPGAAAGSRRWPADRFAEVARRLTAAGETVLITAGPAERGLAHRVAAQAVLPPLSVWPPEPGGDGGLTALAGLIAGASLVISNDTGVAHLGFAYGVPSVTLYGPVSPEIWGPPAERVRAGPHRVLWHGTGLRPGDPHGAEPDPRLLRITVGEVLAAARACRPGVPAQPT